MNAEIHEAMQIARNFQLVNKTAKEAANKLSELRAAGSYFITPEQIAILRQADLIIDEIRDKSTEWESAKYFENLKTEKNV